MFNHRYRAMVSLLIAALVVLQPTNCFAWGFRAHGMSMRVALRYLKPEAKAEAERLLELFEPQLERAYESGRKKGFRYGDPWLMVSDDVNRPGPFERASIWADLVKSSNRKSATYHYVNIPLDSEGYDSAKHDPEGIFVISRIEHSLAILRGENVSKNQDERDLQKAAALVWLLHLVGDMHQPLHVACRYTDKAHDKGGNNVKVTWTHGRRDSTNLHAAVEVHMIESDFAASEKLCIELAEANRELWQKGAVIDWANESMACSQKLYFHPIANGQAEAREVRDGDTLGSEYYNAHHRMMCERLAASGVRTAKLLNAILAK